jgi:hypothetical protein
MDSNLDNTLNAILTKYSQSFNLKIFLEESLEEDVLMQVFGLTQAIKAENKQYWGRELGMCWQLLLTAICRQIRSDFEKAPKYGKDEPCDLVIGKEAIDTKYRIGSGDSGTLKKFRQNAKVLLESGYNPVLLILRNDNLPNAINTCETSGWQLHIGDDAFNYIKTVTGFDLENWLVSRKNLYKTSR